MNGAGVTSESFSNKNKLLEAAELRKDDVFLLLALQNTTLELPDAQEEFFSSASLYCGCADKTLFKSLGLLKSETKKVMTLAVCISTSYWNRFCFVFSNLLYTMFIFPAAFPTALFSLQC